MRLSGAIANLSRMVKSSHFQTFAARLLPEPIALSCVVDPSLPSRAVLVLGDAPSVGEEAAGGSTAPARRRVITRAKATMDVVVHYADVLHEGIHTRGAYESMSLRLQLLRERLRLRC
jgi:hypothetical protein